MRAVEALAVSETHGLPRYLTLQPHYNLYERASFEGPLQDLCVRENIGAIPHFALVSGFLTGKYRRAADFGKSTRGGDMHKFLDEGGLAILAALDRASA